MSAGLLERISDMMKADLADFFEMTDQEGHSPTREVDDMLVQLRAALGERLAKAHKASKTLATLSEDLVTYASKAEFAVANGRDDLARSALAQKVALTRQIDELRADLADIDDETRQLEAAIAKLVQHRGECLAPYGVGQHSDPANRDQASQLAELDALFAAKQAET